MPALNKDPSYQEYQALTVRPKGLEPWQENENGEYDIGIGELFCRVDVADEGDPVELCEHDRPFSHTGNLRAHVTKVHKLTLAQVHKGTSSGEENLEAKKFYKKVMARHHQLEKEYDPASPDATGEATGVPDAPITPSKAAPKEKSRPHRPKIPRKKNGEINRIQARKQAGITGKWCTMCKDGKRSCPDSENYSSCLVWNYFSDDSDGEDIDAVEV